ncbi:MAG: hypothetical protein MZV49_22555 [Rhodopseudomonas palustris]|nr:hypothetical protein [Rhodopseudomonas palustris]
MLDRTNPNSPLWTPPLAEPRRAGCAPTAASSRTLQRPPSMRAGLPVHPAGLSGDGAAACTAAPAIRRGLTNSYFGPFRRMLRASLTAPRAGAQWTGITTQHRPSACSKPARSKRC